jgi:hypothetical protein
MVNNQETEGAVSTQFADDQFYRALAAQPRRRVLFYLIEEDTASRAELARVLAGWRASKSETMVPEEDHKEILLQLYHTHLPCLAECELIQYDRNAGTVTVASLDPEVRQLIRWSVEAGSDSR